MIIDYHTHHNRCGHAVGSIEDYILRGMEIGVHQLGVSDHMPLFHIKPSTLHNGLAMAEEEMPRYVEEVLRLKEKYKDDIDIRLGIEADYVEGFEEEIVRSLGSFPWDYVIGSVHFLGEWDLFDSRQRGRWESQQPEAVYEAYYQAVAAAARSGLFDIIGHLDGIKRFAPVRLPEEWGLQQAALEAVAASGVTVEMNTSGLRSTAVGLYPCAPVLAYCASHRIPVTLGSDAHHPRHVAACLDEGVQLVRQAGLEEWSVFTGRKRTTVPMMPFLALAGR